MSILFYDDVVFQTVRAGLSTVRWKKVEVVSGIPVDITAWSTVGVVEIENGNYAVRVPIEDTDPLPTYIVMDTGGTNPFTKVVKAVPFDPARLTEVSSGGGVLYGRVSQSSLSHNRMFLEVVQGEEKTITFLVEAVGRFVKDKFDEIMVKFRDPKGTVVVVEEDQIERVTEELDVQVLRATLTAEQTASLSSGLLRIEIVFDTQKAVLTQALKVVDQIQIEEIS